MAFYASIPRLVRYFFTIRATLKVMENNSAPFHSNKYLY